MLWVEGQSPTKKRDDGSQRERHKENTYLRRGASRSVLIEEGNLVRRLLVLLDWRRVPDAIQSLVNYESRFDLWTWKSLPGAKRCSPNLQIKFGRLIEMMIDDDDSVETLTLSSENRSRSNFHKLLTNPKSVKIA